MLTVAFRNDLDVSARPTGRVQSGDGLACDWNNCIDCWCPKRNRVSKNLNMDISVTCCCVRNQLVNHQLKTIIYLAHVSGGWKYGPYGPSGLGWAQFYVCGQLLSQLGAAGPRCFSLSSQCFYLVSHYPTVKPGIIFMVEAGFQIS